MPSLFMAICILLTFLPSTHGLSAVIHPAPAPAGLSHTSCLTFEDTEYMLVTLINQPSPPSTLALRTSLTSWASQPLAQISSGRVSLACSLPPAVFQGYGLSIADTGEVSELQYHGGLTAAGVPYFGTNVAISAVDTDRFISVFFDVDSQSMKYIEHQPPDRAEGSLPSTPDPGLGGAAVAAISEGWLLVYFDSGNTNIGTLTFATALSSPPAAMPPLAEFTVASPATLALSCYEDGTACAVVYATAGSVFLRQMLGHPSNGLDLIWGRPLRIMSKAHLYMFPAVVGWPCTAREGFDWIAIAARYLTPTATSPSLILAGQNNGKWVSYVLTHLAADDESIGRVPYAEIFRSPTTEGNILVAATTPNGVVVLNQSISSQPEIGAVIGWDSHALAASDMGGAVAVWTGVPASPDFLPELVVLYSLPDGSLNGYVLHKAASYDDAVTTSLSVAGANPMVAWDTANQVAAWTDLAYGTIIIRTLTEGDWDPTVGGIDRLGLGGHIATLDRGTWALAFWEAQFSSLDLTCAVTGDGGQNWEIHRIANSVTGIDPNAGSMGLSVFQSDATSFFIATWFDELTQMLQFVFSTDVGRTWEPVRTSNLVQPSVATQLSLKCSSDNPRGVLCALAYTVASAELYVALLTGGDLQLKPIGSSVISSDLVLEQGVAVDKDPAGIRNPSIHLFSSAEDSLGWVLAYSSQRDLSPGANPWLVYASSGDKNSLVERIDVAQVQPLPNGAPLAVGAFGTLCYFASDGNLLISFPYELGDEPYSLTRTGTLSESHTPTKLEDPTLTTTDTTTVSPPREDAAGSAGCGKCRDLRLAQAYHFIQSSNPPPT